MTRPVLGILTLYLNNDGLLEERSIYQKMTLAGKKLGLDLFVFTPQDVNYKENRIHAMIYDPIERKWSRKWTSFPHMIYDRCRIQRSPRFEQLKQFRSQYGHLTFLNRTLRNKWTVHRTLSKEDSYRSYLPATRIYDSMADVTEMLRKYPLLYLKPINGTGGRGILRIERRQDGKLLLQGRDQSRKIIKPRQVPAASLSAHLSTWNLKGARYIIQQGIQLKLPSGRVHDYRMLVQKNGEGKWQLTGCAGRIGAAGSVTSNLHGGGKASSMDELLGKWIGDADKVKAVKEEAEQLGIGVAACLEQAYGRLCELALDLAIDRTGHIWLLEVNPKPAREVFAQAGELDTYNNAILRPLEYALWMYEQKMKRKDKKKTSSST
ncbi:YheC/YheD family protein [Paenibacillus sp. GCM10023252]|uniref:YheC/YheD family endospore coat-associated protein n=1 Tax=Paenibacillus sp. GCM10023252 TaxID=3252649 RepID=UPI00361E4D28